MRTKASRFLVLAISLTLAACSHSSSGPIPPGEGGGDDAGAGGGGGTPDGDAHLTGKVTAPEGTIPIAGALVYLASSPPDPIPDKVYCDKCVHLTNGTAFTTTAADGTFDLPTRTGNFYLVVQKGAFRRVRMITVTGGVQELPGQLTRLPSITDKANGDDVPKIAVVLGAWDPIEVVLARLGLKALITKDGFGRAQVLSKDAKAFAIYGLHGFGETSPYPTPITLLTTPSEINKYHIVFIPCSGSTNNNGGTNDPACTGVYAYDNRVKTTLESFVRQGGRLYVSDWSYEYVRQVFSGFVNWRGQTQTIGSACFDGGGTQGVSNSDKDLLAWLKAQGKSLAEIKDAWTFLTGVTAKQDIDADGNPAKVTPKVWIEAQGNPATTSFHHGCGRVLYSTYHTQPTSEAAGPLEPQALALLYLILEVGVCIDDLIPG